MNQYLSIKDLSLYLGIKQKTLYAWVSGKEIPYLKIGRLVRFKTEEIEIWLQSKRVNLIEAKTEAQQIINFLKGKKRA